jgi:hypothetical protein
MAQQVEIERQVAGFQPVLDSALIHQCRDRQIIDLYTFHP